jgi:small-conductance mechanosensitive channel
MRRHIPSRLASLVLALVILSGAPAFGQGAATGDAARTREAVVPEMSRAPVLIDGERLFQVRGVSAYPAEQRAGEIAARIRTLAADPGLNPASLTLDEQPMVSWILAGGQRIMGVLDEDASLEQIDRGVLVRSYLLRIREAIEAYRQARDPARLTRHALYAFIATLALLVAGYIGRRLIAGLRRSLERRYQTRVQDVQIQAFQIVRATQIWHFLSGVLNFVWAFGVLGLMFVYLRYVLGLFPWTRGPGNSLGAIIMAPLQTMATGLINEIPDIAFLVVLFMVIRYVLRMIRLFFESIESGTVAIREFDPEWAWPTYRLIRLLTIALAVIVAYPYVPGSQSDAFKGVSLFIGVVFSLGSSSLIGNIIAGYSMTYRRAFKLGDRVQIGQHTGAVERMRLLVTHLRTAKNEEVIVPNSAILGAEVINYSSLAVERGLILHTTVGIGYETPWRQVEAMLIEAAARTPGLLREPPPFVLQRALGDFCVTYEINAYCNTPETMLALYSAMHQNILDVFNEFGVQIMTPAYEGDPEQPKLVPKSDWYTAPAHRPDTASSTATPPGSERKPSAVAFSG